MRDFRRDQHVLGVLHRVGPLQVGDLAEVIAEIVLRRHVVDAVAELDHVARFQARKLNVEGARRGVGRNRRIVGRALAGLDGLVDATVPAVHAGAAQLHRLAVRFVAEAVLPGGRGGRVGQRLEHDLPVRAGQPVFEHGGDGEIAQYAAVLPVRRRVAQLEEFGRFPGVGFVGARLVRLEVLNVVAHVFVLRANAQDVAQQRQLFVLAPEIAIEICQGA